MRSDGETRSDGGISEKRKGPPCSSLCGQKQLQKGLPLSLPALPSLQRKGGMGGCGHGKGSAQTAAAGALSQCPEVLESDDSNKETKRAGWSGAQQLVLYC